MTTLASGDLCGKRAIRQRLSGSTHTERRITVSNRAPSLPANQPPSPVPNDRRRLTEGSRRGGEGVVVGGKESGSGQLGSGQVVCVCVQST